MKNPCYLAVILWNQLEIDIQTITNKVDFKNRISVLDMEELTFEKLV